MATLGPNTVATKQVDNQGEDSDLDLEEYSCDDVEVNIAVVGKAGSGRSSFVNATLGFKENDAATSSNGTEISCYCHPTSPNLTFSILPNIDKETFPAFKQFLDYADVEKYDAFFIFTSKKFDRRHLIFAKVIRFSNKPIFFVRTKFDNNSHPEGKEKSNEETIFSELRASLAENLKEFHCTENAIYLIDNCHPDEMDFLKLVKAIKVALPPKKAACFSKIAEIQKLIALETFQNFLQEAKLQQSQQMDIPNLDEIKNIFMESGIAGVQRMINKNLGQWKEVKINLAILGGSGAGKSSFINAIRGLNDDDENASMTGITETTRIPTPFDHPTNSNIRFWDLPGIGTPNYPGLSGFCEQVGIEKYDTFLILNSDRFTEHDLLLAKKVKSMEKSFFFIRSKIDNNKRSEKRKKGFDEKKMLKKIRDECLENLKALDVGAEKIFLISSHKPTKWDFVRLQEAILDQLPSKQKESLMFSLHTKSKDVLREKIKLLKDRVWMEATASVSKKIAFWPFSQFVNQDRIKDIIQAYNSQLEFPNHNSDEFQMLSEDLQEKVKKFHDGPHQDFLLWLKSFDRDNTYKARTYVQTPASPFQIIPRKFAINTQGFAERG